MNQSTVSFCFSFCNVFWWYKI